MPNDTIARTPTANTIALPSLEDAVEILRDAATVEDAKAHRDRAAALAHYAGRRRAGIAAQNHATAVVLLSQRRIGELIEATPEGRPGRPKSGEERTESRNLLLENAGIDHKEARRCRDLASVPLDRLLAHIRGTQDRAERLTRAGAIAAISHVEGYDSDEWYTDDGPLALAREDLGEIDLDPASSAVANRRVRATRFWTKAEDALTREWNTHAMWLNCPFSACSRFVAHLLHEWEAGRLKGGLALFNAATDTAYFRELAARFPVTFTPRLSFWRADGTKVDGNRAGQMIFRIWPKDAPPGVVRDMVRRSNGIMSRIGIPMVRAALPESAEAHRATGAHGAPSAG